MEDQKMQDVMAFHGRHEDPRWLEWLASKPEGWGRGFSMIIYGNLEVVERLYGEDFRGLRVLNVGCGGGMEAEWLVRKGAKVICVDISWDFLVAARYRFQSRNLDAPFLLGDGEALPFADAGFDMVFLFGVLHHLPDLEEALCELSRVTSRTLICAREPRKVPILGWLMRRVGWNTEYGGLPTARMDEKELARKLAEVGFDDVRFARRWEWYPRMPFEDGKPGWVINNELLNGMLRILLGVLNRCFEPFGHGLTLVAQKKSRVEG